MPNTLTPASPNPSNRPRAKHHRTETLRPFVQKYQYQQLPLPEPRPAPDEETRGAEISAKPAEPECGK